MKILLRFNWLKGLLSKSLKVSNYKSPGSKDKQFYYIPKKDPRSLYIRVIVQYLYVIEFILRNIRHEFIWRRTHECVSAI